MADITAETSQRLLEPMERLSEVLFGLIMVLTFTCSFSVAGAGRTEVRHMLLAALGCNFAWGIIDAVFYLMSCLSERGHNFLIFRAVRKATDAAKARRILMDALPPVLAGVLTETEVDAMRSKLMHLPEPPPRAKLHKEEWLASLGVALLVFLSTLPVVLPFVFLHEIQLALRISNLIAILMLFAAGYAFGEYSGYRPLRMGLLMVSVGVVLVGLTIAFGG